MNKIIITKMNGQILTAMSNGSRIVQMHLEEKESQSVLGNIYIGKVKNIAKNINAAFIDLGGQMAYYSLTENKNHLFTESLSSSSKIQRQLHAGDEIIVQVSKDAIKTKESVVTGNSFSSKISNEAWKAKLKLLLEEEKDKEFGIIVRTNAQSAAISDILEELRELKAQYYQLLSEADYRTCYTLLYKAVPSYISTLRDTYKDFMEEIVTDDKDIFQEIQEYLSAYQSEDAKKIRLYQDPLLPLGKLYSIEKAMDEALQKRVWLKSGGYLVIEPTEAMTVIDVNTGKYTGKKNLRDTIKKINFEAAVEIGYQLRLRNLSGIILIDFIDMDTKEDRQELMEILSDCCAKDPIKTTVVDMTKLGLVEVTRKKVRKPFREQVGKGEQKR